MKALSLTQPWATLIAIRAKRIETRSWATEFRGPLAIHASKAFPRDCRDLCLDDPFRAALERAGLRDLKDIPLGAIVAVARLMGCRNTERVTLDLTKPDEAAEHEFGDYAPGRWAWFIQGVQPLKTPIACKGALGLWEVSPLILQQVERQL